MPHKCQGRDSIYDFASLGEVLEVEVPDAETIFQNCAVAFLSAQFNRKDVSVGYCGSDNQLHCI